MIDKESLRISVNEDEHRGRYFPIKSFFFLSFFFRLKLHQRSQHGIFAQEARDHYIVRRFFFRTLGFDVTVRLYGTLEFRPMVPFNRDLSSGRLRACPKRGNEFCNQHAITTIRRANTNQRACVRNTNASLKQDVPVIDRFYDFVPLASGVPRVEQPSISRVHATNDAFRSSSVANVSLAGCDIPLLNFRV